MEHCLIFAADIDQRAVGIMIPYLIDLHVSGATKLTLAISSGGGSVVAGITIYNTLIALPLEIHTHNFGNVDSVANVVFLSGSQRFANSSATFMFHGVGFNSNPSERLEEKNILEKLDIINAEHKRIAGLIATRSSLKERACLKLLQEQKTRGADWAKTSGFIQGIREFTIPPGSVVRYVV